MIRTSANVASCALVADGNAGCELSPHELDGLVGAGIWEAFLSLLHGGTDASHTTQSRREGGGPRGG